MRRIFEEIANLSKPTRIPAPSVLATKIVPSLSQTGEHFKGHYEQLEAERRDDGRYDVTAYYYRRQNGLIKKTDTVGVYPVKTLDEVIALFSRKEDIPDAHKTRIPQNLLIKNYWRKVLEAQNLEQPADRIAAVPAPAAE